MDLRQQLVFCKQCQKRKFSDTGIICSLTGRKPDFEDTCSNFEIDPKEAQRIAHKSVKVQKEGTGGSPWLYIAIALFILRIIFRLLRN